MASRRITATEALKHGLVTRVIWPDKFFEEVIPSAKAIAANSAQVNAYTFIKLKYRLT